MKNILTVAYSFIAAIIGAGFASGQEILCYFIDFGKIGFYGIIISVLIYSIFIYTVLNTCIKHNYHSFNSFIEVFENHIIRKLVRICITIFSFAVYSAMLSAFGTSLYLIFNIPTTIGSLISAIFCSILFSRGLINLFDANGFLGIVLATGIIICCIYMMRYREYHVFSTITNASGSACIYSGYNLISLIPMLSLMSRKLKNRREVLSVSLITGSVLFLIMILMFFLLSVYANKIPLGEIPMLTLARRQNTLFSFIYCLLFSGAIITTLFSSGGAVSESLGITNKPKYIFIISATAWLLSLIGFGNLVNTAYRICGITGFIMCIITIISCKFKK